MNSNTVEPMVSVIITTYNTSDSLSDAVESVLNQTYSCYEIIVVDDNNPDTVGRAKAETIMSKYNQNSVLYIKHTHNRNGSAARNTGIAHAKGKYIAFLDDDDVYLPDRLSICVNNLEENEEYEAVYTSALIRGRYEQREYVVKAEITGHIWKELLMFEGLLGTGSNLFLSADAVKAVNGFDEGFIRYQDVEFMLRIADRFKVLAVDQVLVEKNCKQRNIPDYRKYKQVREKAFKKYDYLVERLDEHERKKFFSHQYRLLFELALMSGTKEDIKNAKENLKKYEEISFKDDIKASMPNLYRWWLMKKEEFKK